MRKNEPGEYQKGRKNLIFATLISIPGPLLLAVGMTGGSSATGIADLIRRSCEFLTIFLAWLIYEVTVCCPAEKDECRKRLEVFIRYFTGISMCLSGAVMLCAAIAGFGGEKGGVITSFILAVIGVVINTRLYLSYKAMKNAVLSVQAGLHRVKMLLDGFMAGLLLLWLLLPMETVKNWADLIGCCSISAYLVYSGIQILTDKTVKNEKDQ